MGHLASVLRQFDDREIRQVFESIVIAEESNRINRLRQDLISNCEVRTAFAQYLWNRGVRSSIVRDRILSSDDVSMSNLLLQELWEEELDTPSQIILNHIPEFAISLTYEPYYKQSLWVIHTAPMSRCASVDGSLLL